MRSVRVVAAGVLAALALTACGSTVQQTTTTSEQGGGLAPAATGGNSLSPATTGISVPTTTTGTTGSSLASSGGSSTSTSGSDGGGGGTASGGTTSGAPPPVTGSQSHGPLTIGLTYIDNSGSSAALGYTSSAAVTAKTVAKALVRGINLSGGLAGRKLVPIEYTFNGQSASYSSQAAAACADFTQDHHVSVVLDNAFGTVGGFRDCLNRAGVMVISFQDEGDAVTSSRALLHANSAQMSTDRAYAAVLTDLAGTGYLSSKNQLGMIVEDCPENTSAYNRTLVPLIARLGLKKAVLRQIDCTSGFASAGSAASSISASILAFRSAGVDRVMFVSAANESVILYLFGPAASSQGYAPGYLLSSSAQAQANRSGLPADQQAQLHGVGDSPVNDVDGAPESATDKRCAALSAKGGVTRTTYADGVFVFLLCGPFLLLESALERTGGNAGASAVAQAISGLGSSFAGPALVGRTTFSATRRDGPSQVRVFGYVSSCQCLRYSGPVLPA